VKASHEGSLALPGGQVPNTLRLFGSAPGQASLRDRLGPGSADPRPDLAHRPGRDAGPVSLYALTRRAGRSTWIVTNRRAHTNVSPATEARAVSLSGATRRSVLVWITPPEPPRGSLSAESSARAVSERSGPINGRRHHFETNDAIKGAITTIGVACFVVGNALQFAATVESG
jgi:hypothetical protein